MSSLAVLAILSAGLGTAISAWILGVRMRYRIRRALGTSVQNEVELTSLNTWMKVEDTEERQRGGKLL